MINMGVTGIEMDNENENSLVSSAKRGDNQAVSTLYKMNYQTVLFTVRTIIRDEDTAMDILQDTFIKAFQHIDQINDDTKFTPWVKHIAINSAKDWLKKKKPVLFTDLQKEDSSDNDEPIEYSLKDEARDGLPEIVIDDKETARLVKEILDSLPDEQRIVISMFYYDEMMVKEIAAELGISEGLVKRRLVHGREKIEKKVLELEKRGTRLYSLAPVPFLLLLFRSMDAQAKNISPDPEILNSIINAASQTVSGGAAVAQTGPLTAGTTPAAGQSAGSSAAGPAVTAGSTASTAAEGIGIKVTACVIAAVIAAGAGGYALSHSHDSKITETVSMDTEQPAENETNTNDDRVAPVYVEVYGDDGVFLRGYALIKENDSYLAETPPISNNLGKFAERYYNNKNEATLRSEYKYEDGLIISRMEYLQPGSINNIPEERRSTRTDYFYENNKLIRREIYSYDIRNKDKPEKLAATTFFNYDKDGHLERYSMKKENVPDNYGIMDSEDYTATVECDMDGKPVLIEIPATENYEKKTQEYTYTESGKLLISRLYIGEENLLVSEMNYEYDSLDYLRGVTSIIKSYNEQNELVTKHETYKIIYADEDLSSLGTMP